MSGLIILASRFCTLLEQAWRTPKREKQPLQNPHQLFYLFFPFQRHEQVIQIQVPTFNDKRRTVQYLSGLNHDISLLEHHVKECGIQLPECFSRAAAIQVDLKVMDINEPASPLIEQFHHAEYFASIRNKPKLLFIHLAIHYLGFLRGGQAFSRRLAKEFGDNAIHLYQFPDQNIKELEAKLFQLGAPYFDDLNDPEVAEEVDRAYVFVCDLLGRDVRMKGCCMCIQRIWNRRR